MKINNVPAVLLLTSAYERTSKNKIAMNDYSNQNHNHIMKIYCNFTYQYI